ncbi:unnamed protein product [Amoebophrya sp. A25]|nr:unnamed protein product [Amoebophrya sp. A25]|eukprot:GSA25T00004323001.1
MSSSSALPGDASSVFDVLSGEAVNGDVIQVLTAISKSVVDIGVALREGASGFKAEAVGTANSFGDDQLAVDLASDQAVFARLKASGLVAVASSEETPEEVNLGGTGFSVAFDPLDGSSIVDANFTVGSIFGVWPGATLKGVRGNEQVAAVMAMYGPRITMAVAWRGGCVELTWIKGEWMKTKELKIAPSGKVFAPGNLRATADAPAYMALVQEWIAQRYTLRYTGGMVPDVYHILFKGKGVFSNCSSAGAKAKLRLLYECAPIAFIVEAAGGKSLVDPMFASAPQSVLDVAVAALDQRIGVAYGSSAEIELFQTHMFPCPN